MPRMLFLSLLHHQDDIYIYKIDVEHPHDHVRKKKKKHTYTLVTLVTVGCGVTKSKHRRCRRKCGCRCTSTRRVATQRQGRQVLDLEDHGLPVKSANGRTLCCVEIRVEFKHIDSYSTLCLFMSHKSIGWLSGILIWRRAIELASSRYRSDEATLLTLGGSESHRKGPGDHFDPT